MSLGTRDYTSPRTPSFGQKRRSLLAGALAKDSPLRKYDWVLLVAVVGLSLIGTLLVYSATQPSADPRSYLVKQLINVALGLILMVAVSLLDYRQIRLLAPIVYAVAVLGLVAVLSPLGTTVSGAKAWINLPAGFQVEPSEFAKIGLVLVIAVVFGEVRDSGRVPGPKHAAGVLALALVPVVLVEREPALGVIILLLLMTFGMVALSGLRLRWVAALVVTGAAAVAAVFKLHLLRAYQLDRLTAFLHPGADPTGTGYETIHSKIMIGSGGLFGTGWLHGSLVTASFVPNQQTDFIFSVAGEEAGFVGCFDHRAAGPADLPRAAHRHPGRRPVRPAGRLRYRAVVRPAGLHQHRHDHRDHAGDRPAAAVCVLRGVSHVRGHDRDRRAPVRAPAPSGVRLTVSCQNACGIGLPPPGAPAAPGAQADPVRRR